FPLLGRPARLRRPARAGARPRARLRPRPAAARRRRGRLLRALAAAGAALLPVRAHRRVGLRALAGPRHVRGPRVAALSALLAARDRRRARPRERRARRSALPDRGPPGVLARLA